MGMSTWLDHNRLKKSLERPLAGRLSGLVVSTALLFLLSLFCIGSAFAATDQTKPKEVQTLEFDHLGTGYALDGSHQFLECGQCHIKGIFKGTPILCDGCHNGVIAKGKMVEHIPTERQCDLCHTTAAILETNAIMDHSIVTGACILCHNGITAIGKSAQHVETTDLCDACHTTSAFVPVLVVDHAQVVGSCQECHNGLIATGKSASHQPTTDNCASCHMTSGWVPALKPIDHNEILTQSLCASCHDGTIARGTGPTHFATNDECSLCHNTASFVPANGGLSAQSAAHISSTGNCGACHLVTDFTVVPPSAVDHMEVLGNCISCHNGTFVLGTGRTVTSKAGKHGNARFQTSDVCDACHLQGPNAWINIPVMDHNEVLSNCVDCHDGTLSTGKSGPVHGTGQTSNNCDACHAIGTAWTPVAVADVDHFEVNGLCGNCHNGTVAVGKTATHPATNAGSDCDVCHSPTSWLNAVIQHDAVDRNTCGTVCHIVGALVGTTVKNPTHIAVNTPGWCGSCHTTNIFKPVIRVDHNEISGSCVSCHTPGSTLSTFSKASIPNHINTSDVCEACHTTNAFKPAFLVDHNEISDACSTCHNGVISTGVNANHIPITQECDYCHVPTGWIPTSFDHTGLNFTAQPCTSCHDGVVARGKSGNHIPMVAGAACDGCHLPNVGGWKVIVSVDHTLVLGSCVSCHNGVISLGKNPMHIASTNICEACHINFIGFKPVLGPNVDHNEVLGSCNVCHDGTIATGKPNNHPATTNMCDACHSPGSWLPVVVVDHNEVIGSCFRCHDGSVAKTVKGANHINSSNLCDACHNTVKFKPVTQVDHRETIGNCIDCHNGTIALGKDADHANTSNVCDACHTNFNAFRPVLKVDHNEVNGTCSTCHNNVIAKGKGNGHFQYTGMECDACHSTVRFSITSTFPHNLAGGEYPRPNHRFGNTRCRKCHKQGTSTIPAALTSCARCHQNKYDPGDHRNASVSSLRNCSGSCHKPGPEHRASDPNWGG